MTPLDWLALLHPALVILFVYPVVGATVRLGILVREKRLGITQQPAIVPAEHSDHGRWLASGVVVAVLIALLYSFVSKFQADSPAFAGGGARLAQLVLAAGGTLLSLITLWRVRRPLWRACFALLCWAGLLGLGSQPEIWRLSDNPLRGSFWASHYWSGILLTGLLLWTTAARPEIQRSLRLRRLHVSAAVLISVLLAVQAITGSRDLLEIPLSWQKPAIYSCDFNARRCPVPGPQGSAAPAPDVAAAAAVA
ncbi:MAG: DUF4079 domain-containing protein [Cyanobacteriota bacterium]|nr:DUF4079 domain-containing protein [Cyanobacteriota bacterium]